MYTFIEKFCQFNVTSLEDDIEIGAARESTQKKLERFFRQIDKVSTSQLNGFSYSTQKCIV